MKIHENILFKAHPHWLLSVQFYLIGVLMLASGIAFPKFWFVSIMGVLVVIIAEVVRFSETFYVLDSGVAWQYKFLSTGRKFAEYEKLQNIEVNQSFLENILGIGSIKFDTAGLDKVEVNFHLVKDPYNIEHIVRKKMAEH